MVNESLYGMTPMTVDIYKKMLSTPDGESLPEELLLTYFNFRRAYDRVDGGGVDLPREALVVIAWMADCLNFNQVPLSMEQKEEAPKKKEK